MCSIEEAWAGQTFDGKRVVSQGDIHNAYMSLPNDIFERNNEFTIQDSKQPSNRLSRGINSKFSREPRVPQINRNSNDANVQYSSTFNSGSQYGGIEPRPNFMNVIDKSGDYNQGALSGVMLPSPVLSKDHFNDIENAYDVSETVHNFMSLGKHNRNDNRNDDNNQLLNEDNEIDVDIVNKKINKLQNNKYQNNNYQNNNYQNENYKNINSPSPTTMNVDQFQLTLLEILAKLNHIESQMTNDRSRNMYDMMLYIIVGMLLAFMLYAVFTSLRK
jgi:hypothetical protein